MVGGGGAGRDKSGAWESDTHTAMYQVDIQQGPTVQHRELSSNEKDESRCNWITLLFT